MFASLLTITREFFYPLKCLSCQNIHSSKAYFCNDCYKSLSFDLYLSKCKLCGEIFEYDTNESTCIKCSQKHTYIDRFEYLYRYDKKIAAIVSRMKYFDKTFIAKKIADLMASNLHDLIYEADCIGFIPMHHKRLKGRFFNQSALIAKRIGYKASREVIFDLLKKSRETNPQASLSKARREKNLKKSFECTNSKLVKGKKIILIDDVSTTGATFEECAKTLKKTGAKQVVCIAFAKAHLG